MPRGRVLKDQFDWERNHFFVRMRSQALFRGEGWQLTQEDFNQIWSTPELWARKGRGGQDLCLSLIDHRGPWHPDNVHIVQRAEHIRYHNRLKIGKTYGPHKNKNKT